MPRLLAFLPCERAIIAKDEETVSLITVLQSLTVGVSAKEELGKNRLLPIQWAVFAYWMKEQGEDGVEFEQRLVLSHDSKPILTKDATFTIPRVSYSQVARVMGLPVPNLKTGTTHLLLEVFIRRVGEADFVRAGEYPLSVEVSVASPLVQQ